MKRESNEESLEAAINRLLKVYRLDAKMSEMSALNSWEKLMGTVITKNTREVFIKDKVLHVRLDSAVIREELTYAKSKIIDMMNASAGREIITDAIFK